MDILSLLLLAAALAMDAFSAAVTDGMIVKKIRFYDALKVGLFFGVFQFLIVSEIWCRGLRLILWNILTIGLRLCFWDFWDCI